MTARPTGTVAAVDLGATSGRVMLGRVGPNELSLHAIARFPNGPVQRADGLHWDIEALHSDVLSGLAAAVRAEPSVSSIGVDSWAVDYALIRDSRMLAEPFHYRDARAASGVQTVHALVAPDDLYAANGLQHLSFNTLYQLAAEQTLDVDSILLIPDLFNFWFTGRQFAERTNASTTGLLDVTTGEWDEKLIARLGFPRGIFPQLLSPGTPLGSLSRGAATAIGAPLEVIAVGSHDTASAVVAVPATSENFAYISCGTWGLVGVELEHPVLTDASRAANFTNEGGVDGRVRYLHNVMGLWLLSECLRAWARDDLPALLAGAADEMAPIGIFDANDPTFQAPDDMPSRIAEWMRHHDQPIPSTPAAFVRCIIESLAVAFADAVRNASVLSGKTIDVIHMVGGGSQNELLCQLTADRAGVPVLAGPMEATALGNVLIQARTQGLAAGSLESLRALVAAAFPPTRYLPRAG